MVRSKIPAAGDQHSRREISERALQRDLTMFHIVAE